MGDILVLGYHGVSDRWTSDLAVTTSAFEHQVRALLRLGYRGGTFTDALCRPPNADVFVVTFDDAYKSVLELALPMLRRLSVPATVFVPTAYVGRRASWSGVEMHLDTPYATELDVMSWAQLGVLLEHGWEIGSHARSHPRLVELNDERLEEELVGSREACMHELGVHCTSIAYPYGSTDARVMSATARAGYVAAAGLPRARHLHPGHMMNWPRIGVFQEDGAVRFRLKVSRAGRRLRTAASCASSREPATNPASRSATARDDLILRCRQR